MPHVEIPQAEFKLVILGDANCGKTSLITRFTQGYYRQHPTNTSTTSSTSKTNSPPSSSSSLILRNPNFVTKSIPVTSSNIPTKIQIWDVAGPTSTNNNNSKSTNNSKSSVKGAHTAAKCYYSTSSAILLGYDVTSRSSYEEMRLWLNELRTSVSFHVVVVAIVALKTDLLHGTHHHHYHGNNEYNSNTSEAVPEYEVEQLAQALNVMYIPTSSKLDVNVTSLFQRVAEEVLERRKRGVVAGMQAGDYGYSNNGQQLKKNGGLAGGLGGRYHSSGNGSGGGNNDTTRPSSPVSSKDLYGKYYENDGKKNSNGNSNNNVDSNHDHRDDSNTSSSMMLPNDIMNGNNNSTHNNNDNDAMSTPSDKKKSNHKRRRSSNKPQNNKESSTSTSSTTTAEGCAGSVGAMISACTDADLKDGNGENKCEITMEDEEDDVVHKNGEEDGENTGSFFMMCGPTTWCGNTADTID